MEEKAFSNLHKGGGGDRNPMQMVVMVPWENLVQQEPSRRRYHLLLPPPRKHPYCPNPTLPTKSPNQLWKPHRTPHPHLQFRMNCCLVHDWPMVNTSSQHVHSSRKYEIQFFIGKGFCRCNGYDNGTFNGKCGVTGIYNDEYGDLFSRGCYRCWLGMGWLRLENGWRCSIMRRKGGRGLRLKWMISFGAVWEAMQGAYVISL